MSKCQAITVAKKQCSRVARCCEAGSTVLTYCNQHYNIKYNVKPKVVKKKVVKGFKDGFLFELDQEDQEDDVGVPKEDEPGPKVQAPDAVGEDMVYVDSVRPFLFGSIESSKYTNYYVMKDGEETSVMRTKRLRREMKFIKQNLPLHFNSTVAIRFNTDRPHMATAVIFAPNNTPYDSGCYQFDIFFPTDYPKNPPLVNIMTTGGGKIRFSPNLYANGKVCLSLLGTWRGSAQENWTSKSSLWQVLISIQSAILGSEFPYFDEPGANRYLGTTSGDYQKRVAINGGYEHLREHTVKYAMSGQLQVPVPGFEELIQTHFRIKMDYIRSVCFNWLEEAKESASVGHYDRLKKNVEELEKEFIKLN